MYVRKTYPKTPQPVVKHQPPCPSKTERDPHLTLAISRCIHWAWGHRSLSARRLGQTARPCAEAKKKISGRKTTLENH